MRLRPQYDRLAGHCRKPTLSVHSSAGPSVRTPRVCPHCGMGVAIVTAIYFSCAFPIAPLTKTRRFPPTSRPTSSHRLARTSRRGHAQDDLVLADRAGASIMADDQQGLACRALGDKRLDDTFGDRIDGIRRFVEDEKAGAAKQRPGNPVRCRWPPERLRPRVPTRVSKPAGRSPMKRSASAARPPRRCPRRWRPLIRSARSRRSFRRASRYPGPRRRFEPSTRSDRSGPGRRRRPARHPCLGQTGGTEC